LTLSITHKKKCHSLRSLVRGNSWIKGNHQVFYSIL